MLLGLGTILLASGQHEVNSFIMVNDVGTQDGEGSGTGESLAEMGYSLGCLLGCLLA